MTDARMRDTLSLQLSLFQRQKAEIAQALADTTPVFRAYERAYQRHTARYREIIDVEEVHRAVCAADVVLVGDYHTLPAAQQTYLTLAESCRASGRPLVLALEFVEGRHQALVDQYLRGELQERAFASAMTLGDLWRGFQPIFEYARRHRLAVLGIDSRPGGPRAVHARDAYAARRMAQALKTEGNPRVLALMGQFHVAPPHLPRALQAFAPAATQQIVYQNCEAIHWTLARERRAHRARAVRMAQGALCLLHTSPVVCQQTFLDYLEGEAAAAAPAAERFREVARAIGELVDIDLDGPLSEVEVATLGDPDVVERLRERGAYDASELRRLRAHMLSRESCYLPRARMAVLASASPSHAAEEATHFIRHVCLGDALTAQRRPVDAFYARVLEEALGFFGSKLVNPARPCTTLPEWAMHSQSRGSSAREVAAFVLAHEAALRDSPAAAARMIPVRQERLFLALGHAIGYLLGEALFHAFETGTLSRGALRGMFRDPFVDAQAAFWTFNARFRRSAPERRTSA